MPPVSSTLTRRIRIGAIAALAASGLLLLAPSASSQTVTPQSVDPLQHFIDCAGVLITAPDIHAANCLPSNVAPETKALGAAGSGGGPVIKCVEDDIQIDGDSDCRADDTDNIRDPT
ncbi:MAG: hypothetical protein ABS35_31745 [Kaistia sp. SCN 65-12]|jgi:hypothetical protein|nr:hypothetical protein [Devosia sp.]ODT15337.1 MAG: hypothetical protein ABS35_31745 [Kaistia sp. SCN 65-12]